MNDRIERGTLKQLAAVLIAIVIVLVAGAVIGQAPAIFGADIEDPEASIEFSDQPGDGTSVTIDNVSLSNGGFVVITNGGDVVGVSEYLGSGEHENVTVEQDDEEEGDLEMLGQLTATVHQDTTDNETYAYEETDGEEDRPYLEDGYPVSDTATVTMADRDETESDSFVVENVTAPSSATTNETIEVFAEVRNPTEFDNRQHVEFRLDGETLERQVLELGADETREISFEIDLNGADPGNQTFGVYTADDGSLDELEIEYAGPATLEVVDVENGTATLNAALPADGFVAVGNDSGEALGVSEALEPGAHEEVAVEYEGNDSRENLTAVLYEGDPDEPEEATPFEEDGERVEESLAVDEGEGAE